jgi:phospholipase C
MPEQEPGTRKARALPYELLVHCRLSDEESEAFAGKVWIDFANTGRAGAAFYVYNGARSSDYPRRYTVSATDTLSDYWLTAQGSYDLNVYGPNGYLCQFRGNTAEPQGKAEVKLRYDVAEGNVIVSLTNTGSVPCRLLVSNSYSANDQRSYSIAPGASTEDRSELTASAGWYDLFVTSMEWPAYLRRFAGHLETGRPSISDPAVLED